MNIQPAGESLDAKKGVVFAIVDFALGGRGVTLEWTADDTLVIHHPARSRRLYNMKDSWGRHGLVRVKYVPE